MADGAVQLDPTFRLLIEQNAGMWPPASSLPEAVAVMPASLNSMMPRLRVQLRAKTFCMRHKFFKATLKMAALFTLFYTIQSTLAALTIGWGEGSTLGPIFLPATQSLSPSTSRHSKKASFIA